MKYKEIDASFLILPCTHNEKGCKEGEGVSLARSIGRMGLISPLYVKEVQEGGRYEIISGKRRFCACRLAGLNKIPCLILEKEDSALLVLITLGRYGEKDPFELAELIKTALVKSSLSAEALAEKLGMETCELLALLLPTLMGDFERELALRHQVPTNAIYRISALPDAEARLLALTPYMRSKTPRKIRTSPKKTLTARRRTALGGLGFFENTLKRSIEILKSAGANVENKTTERAGEVEYKVTVRK